jgi:serpin B
LDETGVVAMTDTGEVVRASTEFAIDLYRGLAPTAENLAFSPLNVFASLAMGYAGAAGTTAAEMASVLHSTALGDELHQTVGNLLGGLRQAGGAGHPRLEFANGVWGDRGVAFRPAFVERLADAYGAPLQLVDFVHQAPAARAEINEWVANHTSDMIRDLLAPRTIDSGAAMVIISAAFLDASWRSPFDPAATVEAGFTRLNGAVVGVPMMRCVQRLAYARRANHQAVDLPYVGDDLSIVVIVPDPGRFAEVESRLDSPALGKAFRSLMPCEVMLGLPRFTLSTRIELAGALVGLGMVEAFSLRDANFSAASARDELFLTAMPHEARIEVDETGTRASAAAAVVMQRKGGLKEVIANRPFLFAVRDRATSALLFLGRVLDPTA